MITCPMSMRGGEQVVLGHGGGGQLSRELVEGLFVPAFSNPVLARLGDSSVLDLDGALAAARRRGGPTVLVFGASVDKEIEGMLAVVADRFDRIVLTRAASSPRSAPVERLSAACAALGVAAVEVSASPAAALARARRIAGTRGMVCIAGSFFLAGEIGTP